MALIIEDGTIVAGANSYVTLAEVRASAELRGVTVSADDTVLEPKVHLAMDWFEGLDFAGTLSDDTQELKYPRTGVVIDSVDIAADTIAKLVKRCVIQATLDATTIDLQPSYGGSSQGALKRKKLDVLEKEFFPTKSDYGNTEQPRLVKLMNMVNPLLSSRGLGAGRLQINRV